MALHLLLLPFPGGVWFPGLAFWDPEIQACARLSLEKHPDEHNARGKVKGNRESFSLNADTLFDAVPWIRLNKLDEI